MRELEGTYRMWDEISRTPDAVDFLLQGSAKRDSVLVGKMLGERGIRRVLAIGCGTSYYAAMTCAWALSMGAGVTASAHDAFTFENYEQDLLSPYVAAIVFSHSGATRTTVECARAAKERGALTIAVTDIQHSPLWEICDVLVYPSYGLEPVEPKTRSYVTAAVASYAIASGASGSGSWDAMETIPNLLRQALSLGPTMQSLARRWKDIRRVFLVGGGPNYVTAREIALKFQEAVLLQGVAFGAEEAFHGPIASLGEETLVIGISAKGKSSLRTRQFLSAAAMLGCPALEVTSVQETRDGIVTVPVDLGSLPEVMSGSVLVLPLYMLVYYSALVRGNNPDSFRVGDTRFADTMDWVKSQEQGGQGRNR